MLIPSTYQKRLQPIPEDGATNNSCKLTTVLYLTIVLLIIQIVLMSFLRVSMFTITVYLHSLYVLLIGMVNHNAINYVLIHCAASIKMDIVYLIFEFTRGKDLPILQHDYSQLCYFIFIAVLIITIILRVVLIVLFAPFRKAYQEQITRYSFLLCGHEMILHKTLNQSVN